jgi:hypothetical protein
MKKLIAALMTVLFLGSTTGMVFADATAPATTPAKVSHKSHKKSGKGKKSKPAPVAASTTPTAK